MSRVAAHAPEPLLRAALRLGVGRDRLALCLHRAPERRRPGELLPAMALPAATLDRLVEFLVSLRPRDVARWLTISFDDGYEDSARWLLSRASRFPTVEFLFFVCPEKIERRVGYRWDLLEKRRRQGCAIVSPAEVIGAPGDPRWENERPELQGLADEEPFRLAGVEQCRSLQRLPNVDLGNHTNTHLPLANLGPRQVLAEYRRSALDFERLFGTQRHFAIPFGTPGLEYSAKHVTALRRLGDFQIWSTLGIPYRNELRRPGAVLPRLAVDGQLDWKRIAFVIAARALKSRL